MVYPLFTGRALKAVLGSRGVVRDLLLPGLERYVKNMWTAMI